MRFEILVRVLFVAFSQKKLDSEIFKNCPQGCAVARPLDVFQWDVTLLELVRVQHAGNSGVRKLCSVKIFNLKCKMQ